jgi:hypothetical protein
MLHWCEREVRWGADWLSKTHVPAANGTRPDVWSTGDKFVAMVWPSLNDHQEISA